MEIMGNKNKMLRQQLNEKGIIIAPGCYDALSAKVLESVGFKTLYVTGHGVSVSLIGKTDAGLTTMTEVVSRAQDISNSVSVPIIVDADTGYGNPVNVQRTVRLWEQAGASGIQLEDQKWPKKCGHFESKKVISKADMIQKIRAAVDARTDPNFVIIARTDSFAVAGMDDAVDRLNAYMENGADIGFIDGLDSLENLKRQATEVKGFLLANMVEGGKTAYLKASELETMGYKIVIFPLCLMYAATYSMFRSAETIMRTGYAEEYKDRLVAFDEFNRFMGLQEIIDLEKKYGVG